MRDWEQEDMRRPLRKLGLTCVALIGLLAAACASPKAAGIVESADLVWPDPPQTARTRNRGSTRAEAQ